MNRIDKLVEELCPNGVKSVRLGELCDIERGNGLQKSDFVSAGIGCIHYGQIYTHYSENGVATSTVLSSVTSELAAKLKKVYPGNIVMACTSENLEDVGKNVVWEGTDTIVTGGHSAILRPKSGIIPRYISYFTATDNFYQQKKRVVTGTKVIELSAKKLAGITIPLPPLEVQQEIVNILDNFTELEAELEAELVLRKKQYEYYRDTLLSFSHDDEVGGAVQWVRLGDLCEMRNGYTPSKSNNAYWSGDTVVPWFRMDDIRINGHILNDSLQHVTREAVKGRLFPANSIILATTATIGEHALITADSLANQQFTYLTIRELHKDNVDIKYFYYYMYKVDDWCKEHTRTSSFPSVDMNGLKKLDIPIPPLTEQQRIANILDKFSDYTTSLTSGLPAEIKLRRQQYEYYRDRLLRFS